MKIILACFLIFLLQFSNCVDFQKNNYDLTDNEDHVFVVKLLFEKLTELLNKTTKLDESLTALNQRVATIEGNLNSLTGRINGGDGRINVLNSRFQDFDNRINSINSRLGSLDGQLKANKIDLIQRMDGLERRAIIPDSGLN
ncbi:uncharacterized protein LOC105261563 [Musca domestica]|uniref:Uncharacterized protein LOC105261563 n=1 Tax=Musca domestica TaxID=7370 RepID=A0A1I8NKL2_MUSDO|nr:uncharacterized protein LOC105261563 [Musca domestica]XP_058985070.1 uncharacterized protein LOC105261563 [Musca domestica]